MTPRRKIPTKSELIQLQKLYKTDEKIGERLGGVPAYLVAYWRRKKNVARHSVPKFSESEIRNLWERFGDDDRCGLELGISKAAFYNWRRRYSIREKPAFLKLEQLELNLPGMLAKQQSSSLYGEQTVAQKMLAIASGEEKVTTGELIMVEPDLVTSHQDSAKIIEHFKEVGVEYVRDPSKIAITLAQCTEVDNNTTATNLKMIREFVRKHSIQSFYDLTNGTCHQSVIEHGNILPGQLILGTNRYIASCGAFAAFATDITPAEAATIWAGGKIWLKVPETIRIDINGRRPRGILVRDIALSVLSQLGVGSAEYQAVEFYGTAISHLQMSERIALCNITLELGAKAVICPFEATTRRYLNSRTTSLYQPVIADKDAIYRQAFQFNIEKLQPQIIGPGRDGTTKPVPELDNLSVQQIVIGQCASGRFDDLRIVADILKSKKVHADCRLTVIPASHTVYLEALKKGLVRAMLEAGAEVVNPSGHSWNMQSEQLLGTGERCLSTGNHSFFDRFDRDDVEIYLCSTATAAVSALNGRITDPTPYVR